MTGVHEDVSAWAVARWDDVCTRELGASLRVGPEKPMGSLRHESLGAARAHPDLARPGVEHLLFDGETGVWTYAWHFEALGAFLREPARAALLRRERWPTVPREFVRRVRQLMVRPATPLFVLLADAHGDRTTPGRPDVCPGHPREDLLAGFELTHGFEDPTAVYFRANRRQRRGLL